jgi:p-methyltransferase
VRLLRRHDILTVAAFVIGFPGETDGTVQDDIDFIETSGTDYYTLKEFYYMPHAPIHERREEFGLSGMGSEWRHNTMDSRTAQSKKLEIFRTVKNSVFLDADANLWHLAYLYDQGYGFADIMRIQRALNAVAADQLAGRFDDDHPAFSELSGICSAAQAG